MTDIWTPEKRSEVMSRIRSGNTKPERIVRSWLHRSGYRFRLHRKNLPGSPDIVLSRLFLAIFVHGCFWHRHPDCKYAYNPKTNVDKWERKFRENVDRDQRVQKKLRETGWRVVVIWECQVKSGKFADILTNVFEELENGEN